MNNLNMAQQSGVAAVGMSYLRGPCGVTRQDGERMKACMIPVKLE